MDLNEFDKINEYLLAAKDKGLCTPADQLGRKIFENWELRCKPLPFEIKARELLFPELKLLLPEQCLGMIAHFSWDPGERCATLLAESENFKWKISLRLVNGALATTEEDIRLTEKHDSNLAGLFEIVYDVIYHLRAANGIFDPQSLSKKKVLEAVAAIAEGHNPKTIKAIKKLSLPEMRKLLKDTSADMAEDELSKQLSLGLDGNYANDQLSETAKTVRGDSHIPERTAWEVLQDLNYLSAACRLRLENEREFVLPFTSAKVVGPPDGTDIPIKVAIDPDAPLSQGDIVYIKRKGESNACGTFKIDIFDAEVVYGRLRGDFDQNVEGQFADMEGSLPRSPSEFIAGGMEHLKTSLERGEKLSPAQDFALGLKSFGMKFTEGINSKMDPSQDCACKAALNASNPVVLIQGPPGTGKSFVLEQALRSLCTQGMRILVAAPSNTAVDNICRRLEDMPVARFGNNPESIAPDVRSRCWIGETASIERFLLARKRNNGACIYAGTCVGLLRDKGIQEELSGNGLFDVMAIDEAGMCAINEFLLCAGLAKRILLFGDHQQLPPFPMPHTVEMKLRKEFPVATSPQRALSGASALEYLVNRGIPIVLLQRSYRCQNPRLLRFASTLFYDAVVKPSVEAEYYRLPYRERELQYPPSTMQLHSTSALPEELKAEHLCFDGHKPGLENRAEAILCAALLYKAIGKYPLKEISIIAPYRRQVKLIREMLSREKVNGHLKEKLSTEQWESFLHTRIATVDSFQGGESDVVITCYVRSNKDSGVGFVDNPNRINVAHTRCRREMHIVGDFECLTRQAKSGIFKRLERAFRRDGEIIEYKELPVL